MNGHPPCRPAEPAAAACSPLSRLFASPRDTGIKEQTGQLSADSPHKS
ncbi:hypothetical protein GCM10009555_029340 [Acrocarpospora macrocephala]|nr:hypothetical protein [Acrocarpospora macrocephala]